jgi:hypothetical protein
MRFKTVILALGVVCYEKFGGYIFSIEPAYFAFFVHDDVGDSLGLISCWRTYIRMLRHIEYTRQQR